MKHTPGPWKITTEGNKVWGNDLGHTLYIGTANRMQPRIAEIKPLGGDGKKGEAEANARLIASAPDLYEACKELIDSLNALGRFTEDERFHAAIDNATTAIDKAEGSLPA